MSGIDWSKAPEWATMYGMAGPQGLRMWFNDKQYAYADDVGAPIKFGDNDAFARDRDQFTLIADRPSQAWSGEGLPPVGVKCEFEPHNDVWGFSTLEVSECTVIAYHNDFVWLDLGEPGIPVATRVDKIDFRPIRTPEQIAADERTKACDRMYGVIIDNVPEDRRKNGSDIVEALYDAGYRKQADK